MTEKGEKEPLPTPKEAMQPEVPKDSAKEKKQRDVEFYCAGNSLLRKKSFS